MPKFTRRKPRAEHHHLLGIYYSTIGKHNLYIHSCLPIANLYVNFIDYHITSNNNQLGIPISERGGEEEY